MIASTGMIQNTQTPWYSNDHISDQNFSETIVSFPRFFENNIFPNSMKLCLVKWAKRIENTQDCSPSPRYPNYMGKRDCNGGQPLKLRHERLAACTRCKQQQQQQISKPFLDNFRGPKVIDHWLFCYEPTEPMLVVVEAIVWINKNRSQDISKPRNFHHLLHFKPFYHFNHFQSNQTIICVLFLPFTARNPLVHDIVANFPMTSHIR